MQWQWLHGMSSFSCHFILVDLFNFYNYLGKRKPSKTTLKFEG